MLNQNSGLNLFLPYDMTDVGSGIDLPIGRPIRKRRYNGGSRQARAGRGISSMRENESKHVTFESFVYMWLLVL